MNIMNLTPHELNIYNEAGDLIQSVPPSGIVARIETFKERQKTTFPFFKTKAGLPMFVDSSGNEVHPPLAEADVYVVSGMFRQHYKHEKFYQPGELMRDDAGRVIGCVGLSQ